MLHSNGIVRGLKAVNKSSLLNVMRCNTYATSTAPTTKPYNTKPVIKEFVTSAEVEPFQTSLKTFIEYLKTPKRLKVLLYRERNKQRIVELDIKDPVTGKLYEQREPFKSISTKVLTNYLLNVQCKADVQWLMYQMKSLSAKKHFFWYEYLKGEHFAFLTYTALFRTNQHSEVTNFFNKTLRQPKFKPERMASVYDIEHYFNSVITTKLLKKYLFNRGIPSKLYMKVKVETYYNNVIDKQTTDKTGLAKVLVDQLTQGESPVIEQLKSTFELPQLSSNNDTPVSRYLNFVNENTLSYISTRVLALVGNTNPQVLKFNEDYQLALQKTGKTDLFDTLFAEYKQIIESEKAKKQEVHLKTIEARKAIRADAAPETAASA